VIDLHCHIIPGIDDGPEDLSGALDLARAQVAAGVETVAATSHVDWSYENRAATFAERLPPLRAAIADAGIPLRVVSGGEVSLTLSADLSDAELDALKLGGGPWLLLEAPLNPSAVGLERIVRHVQGRGHQVLLAHPERCPAVQREPEILEAIVREGALTQLTAGAFAGVYGQVVRRAALDLVGRGVVHVIASDAHNADRRPPGLREPLEQAGFGDLVPWFTRDVPAAILDGGHIPPAPVPFPAPRARRRLFRR
jgi:protein-tyrosine phosphatase